MPLAVVLVGTGLVLMLPVISRSLARMVARSTRSVSLGLAMRRNEVEPGGALRVATGLVVLVFAASLVQGVLIEIDQVAKHTSGVQTYTLSLDDVSDEQQHALETVPGVRAHALSLTSWWKPGVAERPPYIEAVVATCAQVRRMAPELGTCVDRRSARLVNPAEAPMEDSVPGTSFQFRLRNPEGRHQVMTVAVPRREARYDDVSGLSPFRSGTVLLTPSMLPAGFRPEEATLVLLSSSEPDTVRAVLDGIGGVDPTIAVETPGVVVTSLQQITVVKTLLAIGMILGLIIGVAAYLVAATDRAVERKPQVTALALLGARPRTLRAVQVAQVVLPLGVGLVLAVVLGKMAESSYLITGGGAIFWDGAGTPLLLVSALGVVAIAALGALPLVGRRIDPELIRRD
jgi:hypothetical protein